MHHIGLYRSSILDHGVFIWKQEVSEIVLVLATDDCLVICDDRSRFMDLGDKLEAMFEVTLQQGAILHFLNLRIIQSHSSISIDQMDHIVETILEPFLKDPGNLTLSSITGPLLTNASFEKRLYEALILTGPALRAIKHKFLWFVVSLEWRFVACCTYCTHRHRLCHRAH
jgi:hypothetical protein